MPLVELTLNMQTPASVAKGFTDLLVEENGKDTGLLMHTYWLIHMHADLCTYTHISRTAPSGIWRLTNVTLMI